MIMKRMRSSKNIIHQIIFLSCKMMKLMGFSIVRNWVQIHNHFDEFDVWISLKLELIFNMPLMILNVKENFIGITIDCILKNSLSLYRVSLHELHRSIL